MTYLFLGSEDIDFDRFDGNVFIETGLGCRRPDFCRCSVGVAGGGDLQNAAVASFAASDSFWIGGRVRLDGGASGGSWNTLLALYSGSSRKVGLQVSGDRKLRLVRWTTNSVVQPLATSEVALPLAQLFKLDTKIDIAAGKVRVFVNQSEVLSYSDSFAGVVTSLSALHLACHSDVASARTYWSEVIVAERDTRTLMLATIVPTHTAVNQWAVGDHTSINKVQAGMEDADAISTDQSGRTISFPVSSLPGSQNLSIQAVKVGAYVARAETGPRAIALGIESPSVSRQTVYGNHRYWRVRGSGALSFGLRDIEFRETIGGANIASGGLAIASSAEPGYPASNAFDGSATTYWTSVTGDASDFAWIGYRFPQDVSISQVALTSHNDGTSGQQSTSATVPSYLLVEYSDDGSSWTTAWVEENVAPFRAGETRTFETPHLVAGTAVYGQSREVGMGWTKVSDIFETNPVTSSSWTKDDVSKMRISLQSRPSGGA